MQGQGSADSRGHSDQREHQAMSVRVVGAAWLGALWRGWASVEVGAQDKKGRRQGVSATVISPGPTRWRRPPPAAPRSLQQATLHYARFITILGSLTLRSLIRNAHGLLRSP